MNKVLIVDDEDKIRTLLARLISLEGFEVIQAANCAAALNILEKSDVDIVLCDVKLPDGNGVELTKLIKEKFPIIEVILLTAYGNIPDGVLAIKNGAFDYITKGDENSKIIPLLHRAADNIENVKRVLHLESFVGEKYSFDSIIGTSKAIVEVKVLAKKVSETDATVMLTGETGTGKEVFAQAIHFASKRNKKIFLAINCSAFSLDILESEMFGHTIGAFTGANKDKKGLLKEADGGTLFLDEIGEMSLELQAKLLRVIETGEFFKVGETKITKTNVRIIVATNRDLKKEIELGSFREDLFYRISVFQIKIPSLKERVEDIEFLANHFASVFAAKNKKKISSLSSEYINKLKVYNWPGNIRELKNVIERSVILSSTNILSVDSLPPDLIQLNAGSRKQDNVYFDYDLAVMEKKHIQNILSLTNGNKAETARLLNIALTTLYRKISQYSIS
jgi:DNA-binding NtrC family response regulator